MSCRNRTPIRPLCCDGQGAGRDMNIAYAVPGVYLCQTAMPLSVAKPAIMERIEQ
jgi:hypothetical protein